MSSPRRVACSSWRQIQVAGSREPERNICHRNAGSLSSLNPGVNDNFNTGIEEAVHPAGTLPRDGGRGACSQGGVSPCGDGTFNTPPLVEAADTGAFFHNNQSTTLRDAIQTYGSAEFQNSPAGQLLRSLDSGGAVIDLSGGGLAQIEAFLTVLNALENIRSAIFTRTGPGRLPRAPPKLPISPALADIDDALHVLAGLGLHSDAQTILESARAMTSRRIPSRTMLSGMRCWIKRLMKSEPPPD